MRPPFMILLLAFPLTACAASTPSFQQAGNTAPVEVLAEPLAQPPKGLTKVCAAPMTLPDGDLSAGAVERDWAADRVNLADCGARHRALAGFYRARDAKLAAKRLPPN